MQTYLLHGVELGFDLAGITVIDLGLIALHFTPKNVKMLSGFGLPLSTHNLFMNVEVSLMEFLQQSSFKISSLISSILSEIEISIF